MVIENELAYKTEVIKCLPFATVTFVYVDIVNKYDIVSLNLPKCKLIIKILHSEHIFINLNILNEHILFQ